MSAKKAPVTDALRIGRIRCVVAITVCSFICVLTFFGLVLFSRNERNFVDVI